MTLELIFIIDKINLMKHWQIIQPKYNLIPISLLRTTIEVDYILSMMI
jgi:hypothetical protein